jgi:hypothetical protein
LFLFCFSLPPPPFHPSAKVKRQSFNRQNCQLREAVPRSQSPGSAFGDSLCSLWWVHWFFTALQSTTITRHTPPPPTICFSLLYHVSIGVFPLFLLHFRICHVSSQSLDFCISFSVLVRRNSNCLNHLAYVLSFSFPSLVSVTYISVFLPFYIGLLMTYFRHTSLLNRKKF